MEKEFIPYKESLDLKKLGFDDMCFGAFNKKGMFIKSSSDFWNNNSLKTLNGFYKKKVYYCIAPLYQQAFSWFRENHNLFTSFHCPEYDIPTYDYRIYKIGDVEIILKEFKTYEEAELECLKKLIEMIK